MSQQEPSVLVSALILDFDTAMALVVRHPLENGKMSLWHLPDSGVKLNEPLSSALESAVRNDLGIIVGAANRQPFYVHDTANHRRDGRHYVTLFYRVTQQLDQRFKLAPGFEAAFINADDLTEYEVYPSTEAALRQALTGAPGWWRKR